MKKLILSLSAIAALVSCAKETPVIKGDPFVAGQKVTLYACAPGCGTKISSKEGTEGGIDFKWQENDVIRVFVGDAYSDFTLVDGAETSSGTFEGEMPGSGNTFTVRYPAEGDPISTTQDYTTEEALPTGNMLFTADNGKIIDNVGSFELKAAHSALRLNLYGKDVKVNSIVATIGETEYTLNCGEGGVDIGDTEVDSTPFRLVVAPGSGILDVKVNAVFTGTVNNYVDDAVNYGAGTPYISYAFSSSAAKTFSPAEELSMAAKEILAAVWAPVNCGYRAMDYPMGRLYQWGRKYGQGYTGDADYPGKAGGAQSLEYLSSALTSHPDGSSYNGKFYYALDDWYDGTDANSLWSSTKTSYDPCPSGWRVPTLDETTTLMGGKGNVGSVGWDATKKGYWFNGKTVPVPGEGLFFPAAGCIWPSASTPGPSDREKTGGYWTSKVFEKSNKAGYITFAAGYSGQNSCTRSWGFSVRCVQE